MKLSKEAALSYKKALALPLVLFVTGSGGEASTGAEQPGPDIEIKRSAVAKLFRTAYVGTADDRKCLWGTAYDIDQHIGENYLVPAGYQPAIPRVTSKLTSQYSVSMYVTPPGQVELDIGWCVSYKEGAVTFEAHTFNNAKDILLTLGCKTTVSVPYKQ